MEFSGNITFEGKIDLGHFGHPIIITKVKESVYNIFFYGTTTLESSELLLEEISSKIEGKISKYDISISSEDRMDFPNGLPESPSGNYSVQEIHGRNYEDVINSIDFGPEVICIREAGISPIDGKRIISIDSII